MARVLRVGQSDGTRRDFHKLNLKAQEDIASQAAETPASGTAPFRSNKSRVRQSKSQGLASLSPS